MRKILNIIWSPFNRLIDLLLYTMLAIVLDVGIFFGASYIYSNQYIYDKIPELYRKIQASSGQNQDKIPLTVVHSDEINAYCDGYQIVIYTGIIDYATSYDEIALILGHELAHQNLEHLKKLYNDPGVARQVTEANADKLGAIYTMKAGYDICIAREFWKRIQDEEGNSLLGSHPDFSYRYEELNINCEGN